MKGKIRILALLFISAFLFGFGHPAAAGNDIEVIIEGKPVLFESPPLIEEGTTLVPFRPVFEALGLTVSWDGDTQTVTGKSDNLLVRLQIGNVNAERNGTASVLPLAPRLINNNTYVPLRFIGEATGRLVKWDQEKLTVTIDAPPPAETYIGETADGKRNGKGKLYIKGLLFYDGDFKDDLPEGQGKLYFSNGKVMYEGEFHTGNMHGKGKLYRKDGTLWYDAQFVQNKVEGPGTVYFEYGHKLIVSFKDGLPEGHGTYYYGDETVRFIGEYRNGSKNGFGTFYFANGNKLFEGQLVNSNTVEGKTYYENGKLHYEGQMDDFKPHGKGKLYDEDGNLLIDGSFNHGMPVTPGN